MAGEGGKILKVEWLCNQGKYWRCRAPKTSNGVSLLDKYLLNQVVFRHIVPCYFGLKVNSYTGMKYR